MQTAKTANQIKSSFELLASGHYQIHSFLYAQEFEQQAYENLIYPLMLVYPLGGNLSGTTYSRNYRVIIADRVLKSEGNELEVESDTQLIALDVLAYWMKLGQNERFTITSSNTITPFWEKWGDEVTGHFVDIGIEEFYDFNSCAIPLSGSIPTPPNPCKDARISVNSVVYGNAPSDTNFNIVVKDQDGDLVGSLIGGEWIVNTGGSCADATYTIEDTLGNVLYTGSIVSGGNLTQAIGDSTANLRDTNGLLISTTSILAEGTDDIVAPDGQVTINGAVFDSVVSNGTLDIDVLQSSGNTPIGSKQGTNYRIDDSVAVIKDSANLTLKTENILAEATENIVINDSLVNVRKSDNVLISAVSVKAENSENYLVADSTITNAAISPTYSQLVKATEGLILPTQEIQNNGVASGFIPSVGTINVTTNSVPTSFTITGRTIDIVVPSGGNFMTATGGTETTDGDYKIHTFTSSGDFEVLTLGDDPKIDFMLVAGGGSGGKQDTGNSAGGGGAGGLIYVKDEVIASIGVKPIVVGSGGAAQTTLNTRGNNGNNSTFLTYTAIGGGGGSVRTAAGGNGGSGGGASYLSSNGTGTSGQGFAGGSFLNQNAGCGGGGAGQLGFSSLGNTGGRGGDGRQTYINGTSSFFAGGGGGSPYGTTISLVGIGGNGGGGNGGNVNIAATNGADNTGGGGGGGWNVDSGAGGSGVCIIRYKYQ